LQGLLGIRQKSGSLRLFRPQRKQRRREWSVHRSKGLYPPSNNPGSLGIEISGKELGYWYSSLPVSVILAGISNGYLLYIFLGYFFRLFQFYEDRKLRANEGAQATFYAIFTLKHDFWWMIPFWIERLAFLQATVGTEFDAEATAFTAVFYYVDFAVRNRMCLGIERQTPEFHNYLFAPNNQLFHQYNSFFRGVNSYEYKRVVTSAPDSRQICVTNHIRQWSMVHETGKTIKK
jgi:hypothetical protein